MNESETPADLVDRENPWPGLVPFREKDREFFFGREKEIQALLLQVRRERLTVVFGKSGLGKTSLLRAGLFPILRRSGFLPVHIRLDYQDSEGFGEQVRQALEAAAAAAGVEAPTAQPGESLWELFHRRETFFWDRENRIAVPLLVLDQFEEIFTLGQDRTEEVHAFARELGDLVEGRIPDPVKARWDGSGAFDLDRHDYKVVISLREDYLADLEGLRGEMRAIVLNRFRLRRMNGDNALRVVRLAGRDLVSDDVARRVVEFVAGKAGDSEDKTSDNVMADAAEAPSLAALRVEPALLSVFCRELNNERKEHGAAQITKDQLKKGRSTRIIATFYERCVADQGPQVRTFIEERLLTSSGVRDSVAWDNALAAPGVTQEVLETLETRRLLRIEEIEGRRRVELTHDVLTKAVLNSREERRHRELTAEIEARERRAEHVARRNLRIALCLTALLVIAAGLAVMLYFLKGQTEEAKAKTEKALARADIQQAIHRREQGRNAEALTFLARAVRNEPANAEARALLFELLLRHNWVLPIARLNTGDGLLAAGFGADGPRTASQTGTVSLWDAATGQPKGNPRELKIHTSSASFSSLGDRVVTAEGRTAQVWDVATGAKTGSPLLEQGVDFLRVELSPDARLVLSIAADGTAHVWDAVSGSLLKPPWQQAEKVLCAHFSASGKRVVTAESDGAVRVWDVPTGRLVNSLPEKRDGLNDVALNFQGDRVITALEDGRIRMWDIKTGRVLDETSLHHDEAVITAVFSLDGQRILSVARDGYARLWDAMTRKPLSEPVPHPHRSEVATALFDFTGRRFMTTGRDGTVFLWNLPVDHAAPEVLDLGTTVNAVRFSPDGSLVTDPNPGAREPTVSGEISHDGRWKLTIAGRQVSRWDVTNGKSVGKPILNPTAVTNATIDPTAKRIVTVGKDGTARVWDALSGRTVGQPMRSSAGGGSGGKKIFAADFSPDGERVVTVAENGEVRLWIAETGEPVGEPLEHGSAVRWAELSPDGQRLATVARDGKVRLWDVPVGTASPTEAVLLVNLAAAVTGMEASNTGITLVDNRLEHLNTLRKDQSSLARFLHWFLSAPEERGGSPFAPR